MFTNKNKLIGFIALIVVIVLVASAVIAVLLDGAVKKAQEEANKEIEALNATIAKLETLLSATEKDVEAAEKALTDLKNQLTSTGADLDAAEKLIAKYEELIDAWTKATPEVNEAVIAINAAYASLLESKDLLPADALVGLEDARMDAIYGAIRSADPKAVADNFVNDVVAGIEDQRYDNALKALIEAVKENGVTYPEDVEGIAGVDAYVEELKALANADVVLKALEDAGLLAEVEQLHVDLKKDHLDDIAAEFIAKVEAIETPITLNSEAAIVDAIAALDALLSKCDEYGMHDHMNRADVVAAIDTVKGYNNRLDVLKAAKVEADAINDRIAAQTVAADIATRDAIAQLKADIAVWESKYAIDDANRYLVNDVTGLETAYAAKLAELQALYDAFKAAVEAIGTVTVESKPAIDAAWTAYDAVKGFTDADVVLGLVTPNTVGELHAVLVAAQADYDALIALIAEIRAEIDRLHGNDPAVSYAEVDALNAKCDQLVALGFELTVINTETVDYVAKLEEVRLIPVKNEVIDKIHAVYVDYYADHATSDRDVLVRLAQSYADQKAYVNGLSDKAAILACGETSYITGLFDQCLTSEK